MNYLYIISQNCIIIIIYGTSIWNHILLQLLKEETQRWTFEWSVCCHFFDLFLQYQFGLLVGAKGAAPALI